MGGVAMWKDMERNFKELQQELLNHKIFTSINSMDDLCFLMESHVFAVWDFMSLVKRLQRELTTITLPWVPPKNRFCSRLINEIVTGEESDMGLDGHPTSHLEMYLAAMREVGSNTKVFEFFLSELMKGSTVRNSLKIAKVDAHAVEFVTNTINVATKGSVSAVLGAFFHGREGIIPGMFSELLKRWKINPNDVPQLCYYLKRHIELDAEEHGPAAEKIIDIVVGNNPIGREELYKEACNSIRMRIKFWDCTLQKIQSSNNHGRRSLSIEEIRRVA